MSVKTSFRVLVSCCTLGMCGCGATEGIVADAAKAAAVEIIEEVVQTAEERVMERFLTDETDTVADEQ